MKSSVDSVEYWYALWWGWLVLLGIDPSTRYRGAVIGNLLYSLPVTPDVSCRPQQLQQLLYITCGLFSLPRLAVLKCIYFIENPKMIEIRDFLFKYETVVINLIFHFLLENVLQFDY